MQASVGLLCPFVPATRCIRFVAIMSILCWSIALDGQEYHCSTISTVIVPRYCYDDLLPHHRRYDITPDQGMEAVPRHVWCCLSSWWVHTIRCTALIRTIIESRVKAGDWWLHSYWCMEWQQKQTCIPTCGAPFFSVVMIPNTNEPGAKWRIMGITRDRSYSGIRQSITHPFFLSGKNFRMLMGPTLVEAIGLLHWLAPLRPPYSICNCMCIQRRRGRYPGSDRRVLTINVLTLVLS